LKPYIYLIYSSVMSCVAYLSIVIHVTLFFLIVSKPVMGSNIVRFCLDLFVIILSIALLSTIMSDSLWFLYFHQVGRVLFPTYILCHIWRFIYYYESMIMVILVGWKSVEWHILIFYDRWLLKLRRRLLVHCLPLVLWIVCPLKVHIIKFYVLLCGTS
jgi:hypothetical protein